MQAFLCTVGVAVAILFCANSKALAQDAPGVRFACNANGTFGPTAELRAKLGVCHHSEEYGTGEGKKDPKCAAFCFTEAANGLKDGVPNEEAFEQMIDSEFPEAERKNAKELLGFCFEQHGKVDVKDEKCVEIAAFSACATSLVKKTKCPA